MNHIDPIFVASDNDEHPETDAFERWLAEVTSRGERAVTEACVIVHVYAVRNGWRRLAE